MKNVEHLKATAGLLDKTVKLMMIALLLGMATLGCKKRPVAPIEEPPTNRHGEVIGTPVKQTIGVSGGTVSTTDKNVKLVIPAGALKSDVAISIQEVESTLGPIAVGKTYRLQPENVKFEKDVDLTFSYSTEDLAGTRKELLYMAYQNSKGDWYGAAKTTYDNKTVTVKTRHFSDWTIYAIATMEVTGKEEQSAGDVSSYRVVCAAAPETEDIDVLLGPNAPTGVVSRWGSLASAQWGSFTADGDLATYTAPTPVFHLGFDMIAYLDRKKFKTAPGREVPSSVSHEVRLLPDEYLRLGKNDYFSTIEKAFNENAFSIVGRILPGESYARTIYIYNSKQAVGKYDFGKWEVTNIRYYDIGYYYNSIYNCNSQEKYTTGSITITKNSGGYIEGKIEGKLQYTARQCNPDEQEDINGSFRVKIVK